MQASSPAAARTHHLGLVLALLAFAQLIIAIDYNIVFVALPEIGSALGFSAQTVQWVFSAYAVAFGGFLLLGGRAADLFGRRRMFMFGLFLYAASSLIGGLATSPEVLIGARAVQGLGGATLSPALLALIGATFAEGRERNRALAVWGGAGSSGMVLGSLLGGVLTEAFGWSAVFYVNVPLAGGAMLLALWLIPPDGERETGRKFDLAGAVTATAGATLLVFTLVHGPEVGWSSVSTIITATIAILFLAAFVTIEARSRDPLMPLRLFTNRNLSLGTVVTFSFMATFGALAYFYTIYFQDVRGYSSLNTGFAFVLPCVGVLIGTQFGGRMATRFSAGPTLITGLAVGAAGTAVLGFALSAGSSYATVAPWLLVLSIGQGIVFTAMFSAALTGVAPEVQGIGSGIASTGMQIGGAVGLAALVAVGNAGTTGLSGESLRLATVDGVRNAMYVAAVAMAATILVAINFKANRRVEPAKMSKETITDAAGL